MGTKSPLSASEGAAAWAEGRPRDGTFVSGGGQAATDRRVERHNLHAVHGVVGCLEAPLVSVFVFHCPMNGWNLPELYLVAYF
jgi:hypothetical protein